MIKAGIHIGYPLTIRNAFSAVSCLCRCEGLDLHVLVRHTEITHHFSFSPKVGMSHFMLEWTGWDAKEEVPSSFLFLRFFLYRQQNRLSDALEQPSPRA